MFDGVRYYAMKLKLLGFLLAIVLLGACRVFHPACQLSTGDLIFICDTTGMGQAIAQSTGQRPFCGRGSSSSWGYPAPLYSLCS